MNHLIGKQIQKVSLSDDKEWIRFRVSTHKKLDDITYKAIGECCSQSWIENVEIMGELGVVLAISNDLISSNYSDDSNECIKTNLIRIRMEYGTIDIDFRNSSNGYYSGYLEYWDDVVDAKWYKVM